jgi:polyribonucleotide nucleotidyltransferase
MIEGYLPQAANEDEIRTIIQGAISHLTKDADGVRPGPKDLGTMMRVVQQRILASGLRADGKVVSEIVRAELGKSGTVPRNHISAAEKSQIGKKRWNSIFLRDLSREFLGAGSQ